jgi:ketosteroid isomerase-like protein
MSDHDARAFIDALNTLEAENDVEPLVGLYAEDSRCENITGQGDHTGPDGARTFWTEDRGLFESVHSEFANVVSEGDVTMLEWKRTGTGKGGDAIDLIGVSVVEFQDGQITRFAGYYDPARLGDQAL